MFLLEVAKALKTERVDYAICGGYAMALHGVVRGTIDIDIVLKISPVTYERAEKALNKIGLVSRLPISSRELHDFRKEYIAKRNLVAWSFIDLADPSRMVDIIFTHDLSDLKSVRKTVGEERVNVVSIADLIKMKNQSGRPQDREDVRALKEISE